MRDSETARPRRMKVVAALAATLGLLSGALLFAEHDASARTSPAASLFTQALLPSVPLPAAPAATAQQLPANLTDAQVLALAQQIANQGVASAQAVTAGQTPTIDGIICSLLLATRAQVVSQIGQLIAAFPALTPQLVAVRTAALAVIDALLARFGCIAVPSGVL